jgi:flagellar hook-associated protein 1 FlgK
MGLNATLATARQSLDIFSAGVQLAGQNISNASTPGYIREQLQLQPGFSYRSGSLILGTGVVATGVQQQINQFLEHRIHVANAEVATASVKNLTFKQLESEIQELGESDLSTALSDFFDAIQDLASQPESIAFRDLVVSQGNDLARDIRSLYGRVDDLRQSQTVKVENLVTEANELVSQIQKLNVSIVQLELAGFSGSDAGAARSERYQALTRLSEILPIQYRELSTGAVDVFTESDYLVLSNTTQQLQIVNTGLGAENYRVELAKTGHDIGRAGGELRGVLESRDDISASAMSRYSVNRPIMSS